jgi:hypothetical protein
MRKADDTLKELGQLYDFQKELARLRLRPKPESDRAAAPDRKTASHVPHSADRGR